MEKGDQVNLKHLLLRASALSHTQRDSLALLSFFPSFLFLANLISPLFSSLVLIRIWIILSSVSSL